MRERQSQRVKERPLEPKHGQQVSSDAFAHTAVRGVSDDRVADRARAELAGRGVDVSTMIVRSLGQPY